MATLSAEARQLFDRARRVNPHAVDAALALAFTAAALATVASRIGDNTDVYRRDDALGIALLLAQTLPIAARSVSPLAALTVSAVAVSLHVAIGYEGVPAGTFAAFVILYSVASMTDVRRAIIGAVMTAAAITVYFTTERGDPSIAQAITTFATYGAGWGIGVYVRSRREYADVLEDRAALLEREREVREREAVASERSRIARELHDMVGHALNLIVIQAGGAQRVFDTKPELARDSLASIESTGRQALTEMERMLGILRGPDGDADLSPQPGLSGIEELARHVTDAGLPVEVTTEGTPVALPSSIDLSAYRIVQEALTNALKHAGPASARVVIRYVADALELEISDDGRGMAGPGDRDDHGGRGLIGMRERVALFGGELSAGPRREGGYRVHARLPIDGATA